MAYACKTSSARRVVGVIPYLPYSRQCKLIHFSFISVSVCPNKLTMKGYQLQLGSEYRMPDLINKLTIFLVSAFLIGV